MLSPRPKSIVRIDMDAWKLAGYPAFSYFGSDVYDSGRYKDPGLKRDDYFHYRRHQFYGYHIMGIRGGGFFVINAAFLMIV